jgi:diguanylate cyclase (GGDEF)-like protein/PAS domain S-box-containing protein
MYWNAAATGLYGYTAKEAVGRLLDELILPEAGRQHHEASRERISGRQYAAGEAEVRDKAGRVFTVYVTSTLLLDENARTVAVVGVTHDVSDDRAVNAQARHLTRRKALFEALGRQASDWALLTDFSGRTRYAARSIATTHGDDGGALLGRSHWEGVHSDDVAEARRIFDVVAANAGSTDTAIFRVGDRTGRWHWVEEVFTNCLEDPDIGSIICNGRDVTARVEDERALRASEARYRTIADSAQEGIWAADVTGRTLYANEKLADILGLPLDVLYARTATELVDPDGTEALAEKLAQRRERGLEQYELRYLRPDGSPRILVLSVSLLQDDTGAAGFLAMIVDVTQTRRAESELRRRALQDDLTGLASGALLTDRLDQALARRDRRGSGTVAVVFADIDQFSLVNDSWGHAAADRLLVQIAGRLATAVRPGDTIARFGGDEFVVICEDTDEAAVRGVADRLLAALAEPFHVGHRRAYVSASIGIALSPPHAVGDLLRFAAAAMHDAKSRGRARHQVFDLALAEDTADRLLLSTDLREALAGNDLSLCYQPIVDLATGQVVGVEALSRWAHPTRGPVPPDKFIGLAEATGLAPTLDRWALTTACGDLARLRRILGPTLRISVNISARHLADNDLEENLLTASGGWDLTSGWLVLEITESAVMDNPTHARALLERLRQRGIGIAIDDFGTGYSSFGYLSQLPFTILKIDRSFVQNITTDADALAIAASIIDLGRALRLTTIAEGIETTDQLTLLRQLGCSTGQGYLWSPAVPVDTLAQTMMGLPDSRFDVSLNGPATVTSARAAREPVAPEHGLDLLIRLHRDGAALTTIAVALNAEGYRTPMGQLWRRATVARVVSDIAYPDLWDF